MKVLALVLLTYLLQSCNQPLSIPKHDPNAESNHPTKKTVEAAEGSYQRFLPVSGNPMLALDTVTGQLCRTYPTLGGAKAEDAKFLVSPFCRDLWMASNVSADEPAAPEQK